LAIQKLIKNEYFFLLGLWIRESLIDNLKYLLLGSII